MKDEQITRAMSCLLEILNDEELPVGRRIDAAQALLAFESPPEVADRARRYLLEVFENKDVSIELRMEALQISRKYESARVATASVVQLMDQKSFIEEQRRQAILRRKMILVMKGIAPWDFPKDWKSDLEAEDWIPPTPDQVEEQRRYMSIAKKRPAQTG
jgi:hypothetical protein